MTVAALPAAQRRFSSPPTARWSRKAMSSQGRRSSSKHRAHTRPSHPRPRKTPSSSLPPRTMRATGPRSPTSAPPSERRDRTPSTRCWSGGRGACGSGTGKAEAERRQGPGLLGVRGKITSKNPVQSFKSIGCPRAGVFVTRHWIPCRRLNNGSKCSGKLL